MSILNGELGGKPGRTGVGPAALADDRPAGPSMFGASVVDFVFLRDQNDDFRAKGFAGGMIGSARSGAGLDLLSSLLPNPKNELGPKDIPRLRLDTCCTAVVPAEGCGEVGWDRRLCIDLWLTKVRVESGGTLSDEGEETEKVIVGLVVAPARGIPCGKPRFKDACARACVVGDLGGCSAP